jgi:hypothetical protein
MCYAAGVGSRMLAVEDALALQPYSGKDILGDILGKMAVGEYAACQAKYRIL